MTLCGLISDPMAQQRGRPQTEQLVEALRSVVELLPAADRGSVRAAAWPLRSLANATTRCLNVSTPQAFQSLGASQLLKRFPRASSLDACLSSCGDVKALCLFFLTSQSDQSGPWTDISLAENRSSVQQQHQYVLGGSGYGGHEPAYQRESRYHYGHGGSGRGSGQPASLDATWSAFRQHCLPSSWEYPGPPLQPAHVSYFNLVRRVYCSTSMNTSLIKAMPLPNGTCMCMCDMQCSENAPSPMQWGERKPTRVPPHACTSMHPCAQPSATGVTFTTPRAAGAQRRS